MAEQPYEIVGPFQSWKVTVHSRVVPFLEAMPVNGGKIALLLDGRYSVDIDVAQAGALIPFIADCIAVALGYTCHPHAAESLDAVLSEAGKRAKTGEPKRSDPFPHLHGITSVTTEPAGDGDG